MSMLKARGLRHCGLFTFPTILYLIILLWSIRFTQSLYYDYTCSDTFQEEHSVIMIIGLNPPHCNWTFQARQGDTIHIMFYLFHVGSDKSNCLDEYLKITDNETLLFGPACGKIPTPFNISTSSNMVHMEMRSDGDRTSLQAAISIRRSNTRYEIVRSEMEWSDAQNYCERNGGTLATPYPVVSEAIMNMIEEGVNRKRYWTGLSMSHWVWMLGCVRWNRAGTPAVYTGSKYNQMSECATACQGSIQFLLQNDSCFCINNDVKMEEVAYNDCHLSCPGNQNERCGGLTTFSQYQYTEDSMFLDKFLDGHRCIQAQKDVYIGVDCDDVSKGFTCSFLNGTHATYSSYVDSNHKELSWQQAVDFCAGLNQSKGLAPIPKWPSEYIGEPMWTSITRVKDWNYPTVGHRKPLFAYQMRQDKFELYTTGLKNSFNKYQFVCQYDKENCMTASSGNFTISSPNYPAAYGHNKLCRWNLTVQVPQAVQIIFHTFSIEDSEQCLYDYFQVQDGATKTRYCGSNIPVTIVTQSHEVFLEFKSDDSLDREGFLLHWQPVERLDRSENSSEGASGLNGGETALLVTFLAVLLVAVVSFVLVKLCDIRKKKQVTGTPGISASSVSNVIYGMSSFMDDTDTQGEGKPYENVSQAGGSGAQDINIQISDTPEYESLSVKKSEDSKEKAATMNSTANLIDNIADTDVVSMPPSEESRNSNEKSSKILKDSHIGIKLFPVKKENKIRSKSEGLDFSQEPALGLGFGRSKSENLTIEDLENLGRDAITVTHVSGVHVADSSGEYGKLHENSKAAEDKNKLPSAKIKNIQQEHQKLSDTDSCGYEKYDVKLQNNNLLKVKKDKKPFTNISNSNSEKQGAISESDSNGYTARDSKDGYMNLNPTVPTNTYTTYDASNSLNPAKLHAAENHPVVGHVTSNAYDEIDMTHKAVGPLQSNTYAEID